tara:strand:+ start:32984 stop:33175 length:192 start_codon:yes stop_codon:yes gene_type:complete
MGKTIDSNTLIEFMNYAGYQFYFERDPLKVAGANVAINCISVSELITAINDFNQQLDDNSPQV